MRAGAASALSEIMRWERNHPEARSIPDYLQSKIDTVERYDRVDAAFRDGSTISVDPYQLEQIREDLLANLPDWTKRREAELELAHYIREQVAPVAYMPELYELATSLEDCRKTGPVGIRPDGGIMVAWDHKCGQRRLCPDESREDTQRVAEFYLPAMMEWAQSHPTHRIFYAVFTDHNFRPGQLLTGKRYLFEKFTQFREYRPNACPVNYEPDGYGGRRVVRSRRQYLEAPWNLAGALVIQEDPLSAHGDWNVHLNAFLMVKGRFDYATAREVWGCNVEFREIDGSNAQAMRHALLEAIKYSAQIVPEKSAHHALEGVSAAPAMVEWGPHLWAEWWRAQQGFRRVRSYGALFALHGKRWDAMAVRERVDLCAIAEVDTAHAGSAWADLAEDTRVALRDAMVHGERLDMSLVEWVGAVTFLNGAGYWVDLIPGHKSKGSAEKITSGGHGFGVSRGGAPPPGW